MTSCDSCGECCWIGWLVVDEDDRKLLEGLGQKLVPRPMFIKGRKNSPGQTYIWKIRCPFWVDAPQRHCSKYDSRPRTCREFFCEKAKNISEKTDGVS